jgi:hypothetical protein
MNQKSTVSKAKVGTAPDQQNKSSGGDSIKSSKSSSLGATANFPRGNSSQQRNVVRIRNSSSKGNAINLSMINQPSKTAQLTKKNKIVSPTTRGSANFSNKMKMPELNADRIQDRLKKKSPWYDSLTEPLSGGTVKIPDAIGVPTGTMQCYQEYTVVTNPQGVAGLKVVTPYPNLIVNAFLAPGCNFQVTNSTATSTSLNWAASDVSAPGSFSGFPWNDSFTSMSLGVRVVSAAVYAYSETTSLTDKGEICGFQKPFGATGTTGSYSDLTTFYGSATAPTNMKKPMKTLWYPVGIRNVTSGTIDYKDFVNPATDVFYGASTPQGIPFWTFGCCGIGLEPASPVKFKVIVNYEFIPTRLVQDIISASPSPQDLQEEELVVSWTDTLPKAGSTSQKEATSSPGSTSVELNESGFGMFFDVLQELAPYAMKAAPMIMSALL